MTIEFGTCKSCGAKMMWAVTENGKRIPLDLDPVSNGNMILVHGPDRSVVTAHYLKKDEETTEDRYTSHFASCPQSKLWSKSKKQ